MKALGRGPSPAGALAPTCVSTELPPSLARVASAVAEGMSDREVASALAMSLATVRTYMRRIYGRLGVHSRVELTRCLAADATPARAELPPYLARVADAIVEGRTDKEIASALGVSLATARTYVRRTFERLHVRSRVQLVRVWWPERPPDRGEGADDASEVPSS